MLTGSLTAMSPGASSNRRVAVLDERFALAARRWPVVLSGFTRRLFESLREEHTRAAICTMPRVEERILALLCHLALR
jgi:hypothetical protein